MLHSQRLEIDISSYNDEAIIWFLKEAAGLRFYLVFWWLQLEISKINKNYKSMKFLKIQVFINIEILLKSK